MKQIQIALNFQANTKQAQSQMQQLSQSLNNIITNKTLNLDSSSISKASQAASELQFHLSKAVNVDTGKLDLSKFNASLASSKSSVASLSANLLTAGTSGQQAFKQLASAIASAQQPALTLGNTLKKMGNTLMNTVRWQISSSAINMITGAFSSAWNYAKDLNTSLTDIRIVAGQSAEEMNKFAKYANKAARALSASTLDYSKASLIYFQQGLSEKEVMERAETTVKMANVTGQSMDEVSNQLTAVWNNFDDGSKSLEYYADVITALGAATASSSEEIVTGLEKFAAVAETVGLSYEYATAALATVTSETRQSAEVVGTAFKTLFARIQDLELGKTLDDGVSLGKYSQALDTVGINILKANGDVKEMNSILEEMGSKWQSLSSAQQVSLAQTVAGVRQYTQLIALMENWDKVKENVTLAEMSEGTLQEQQEIYAESWEAAAQKVQTSLQGIWQQLFDDEVIIGATKGIATFVESISNIVEGMGGLKGIILTTLPLIAQIIISKVIPSVELLKNSFLIAFGQGSKVYKDMTADMNKAINSALTGYNFSALDQAQLTSAQKLLNMKTMLSTASRRLSEQQQLEAQMAINAYELQTENQLENLKKQEQAEEELQKAIEANNLAQINVTEAAEAASKRAQSLVNSEIENLRKRAEEAKRQWDIIRGNISSSNMSEESVIRLNLQRRNLSRRTAQANTALENARRGNYENAAARDDAINQAQANLDRSIANEAYFQRVTQGPTNLTNALERAKNQYIAHPNGDRAITSISNTMGTMVSGAGGNLEQLNELRESIQSVYASTPNLRDALNTILDEFIQDTNLASRNVKQLRNAIREGLNAQLDSSQMSAGELFGISQDDIDRDRDARRAHKTAERAQSNAEGNRDDRKTQIEKNDKQLIAAQDKAAQAADKQAAAQEKLAKVKKDGEKINEGLTASEQKLIKTLGSTRVSTEQATKGLTSAFSGLAFGLSSLSSVWHTLKSDMSFGEKFTSLAMSATMLGPSLVSVTKGLGTFVTGMRQGHDAMKLFEVSGIGFNKVTEEMVASLARKNAVTALDTNEMTKNLSAETRALMIETLSKESTEEQKKALLEKVAAEQLNGQKIGETAAKEIISAASTKINTAATEADTVATIANYAAKFWYVAAIAAVIVAIGALIFWMAKETDAEKNLENQFKASAKAYDQITENLKTAREEYDNLKTSIDAIQESQKTIDQMVEGTREWKNAVIELNAQVLDLIDKYPELMQFIDTENGVYQISNEGYDFLLNQQQEKINNLAQSQVLMGRQKVTDKYNLENVRTDKSWSNLNSTYFYDYNKGRSLTTEEVKKYFYNEDQQRYKTLDEITAEFPALASTYEQALDKLLDTDRIKMEYEQQMATWTNLLASQTLANDEKYQKTEYKNTTEALFSKVFAEGKIGEIEVSAKKLFNSYDHTDSTKEDLNATTINNIGQALKKAGLVDEENIFLNNSSYNAGNKYANENMAKYLISQLTGESIDNIGAEGSGKKVQYKNTGGDEFDYKIDDGDWQTTYYEDYGQLYVEKALADYAKTQWNNRMQAYKPIVEKLEQSQAFQNEEGDTDTAKIDEVISSYISSTEGSALDLSEFTRKEIQELKNNQELYLTGQAEFDESFRKGLEEYEANRALSIQQANDEWSKSYEDREAQEFSKILSEAEMSTEDFDSYVKALKKTKKELNLTEKEWQAMAKANLKNANGLKKLNDIIDDNTEALDKSNKGQASYVTAMNDVRDAMIEWLGIDLGESKITELWENGTLTKAINGSTEAIQQLHLEAAKKIVIDMDLEDTQAQTVLNDLITKVDNLNLKPGMDMDISAAVGKINELLKANQITAEQAQAYWDRVGFHPEVEFTNITAKEPSVSVSQISIGSYDETTGEFTPDPEKSTYQETKTWATISVPQYGAKGTNVAPYVGHSTTTTPAGMKDSKGGSKPKKNTGTKKSDTIERYKKENDQLDDLTRAYDKASKAADRLYGGNRLKAMQENNKLLKQESELLKQKAQRGREEYLEEDKKALLKAAGDAGIKQLEFDENGNITNYEEMMAPLYAELKAAYDAAGETINDKEQEKIDKIKEKITPLEDAIKTYDATLNEIEDLEDEAKEKFYEWQDNNYEALQLKLEIQLELSEDELREIEYKLGKWENDFYKRSESANLYGDQAKVHINNSSIYEKQITDLEAAFKAGDISEADYIEGLKEARDGLYEQNEALLELKESMGEYYGETIDMANEKIAEYTDQIDHTASVLDHYKNIASIIGKETDYEMMDNYLEGQAKIAKDQMEVSAAQYDMLEEQRKQKQAEYDAIVGAEGENSERAKFAKKELDAIVEATNEAQDTMLSNTEAWLEAEKAAVENEMAKIRKEFEKTFAGDYGTFDNLMDSFEKLNTRQEEYLTTTNKIYETNKMMRIATQAMDSTDNKAAKQRINNFIKETQSLQEKNKLSKFELEIQQAKYDILMAQIALEEAQNAKSTVRLTRDAEGNFGYVYTADSDKVADAEQKVADAENALYNKSLEGQQTYTEKYLQARQEMYNELNDLQDKWLNGEIESEEEYNQLKEQILNHYMGPDGILTQYSELYGIAVQTDIKATEDYWGSEFGLMTQETGKWKTGVNGYLDEIDNKINGPGGWKSKITQAHSDIYNAVNGDKGSKQATKDLADESEKLKVKLIGEDGKGGLVKALQDEVTEVGNVTAAFRDDLLPQIDSVMTKNESLITDPTKGINAVIKAYCELKTAAEEAHKAMNSGSTVQTGGSTGNPNGNPKGNPTGNPTGSQGNATIALDNVGIAKGTTGQAVYAGQSAIGSTYKFTYTTKDKNGKEVQQTLTVPENYLTFTDNTITRNWMFRISSTNDNSTIYDSNFSYSSKEEAKFAGQSYVQNNKIRSSKVEVYARGTVPSKINPSNDLPLNKPLTVNGSYTFREYKKQSDGSISARQGNRKFSNSTVTLLEKASYNGEDYYSVAKNNYWLKESDLLAQVKAYDTGGYTGEWGPEGKLAMLHQKELVLNAQDTENFLLGIQMLRSISEILDRNAMLMGANLSNISAFTLHNSADNTLQQEVTIHAEFPNVNDHNEIEIAINNLVNQASQYAHKS